MAKTTTKKKSTKKTAPEKAATKKSATRKVETSTEPAEATPETKATRKAAKEPKARDPRLPVPGTVIQKRNRAGEVVAECEVLEDGGFEYKSTRYKSLSAAAQAAASDLGKGEGRAVNGFLWFGLIKPMRRGSDPIESLHKAWHRYQDRMAIFQDQTANITAEQRTAAAELVEEHANILGDRSRTFLAGVAV